MEVSATAKYIRVQPRKVRIVAREVDGKTVERAAAELRYHPSKGAKALRKVLISAAANARENHGISPDTLRISNIMIDEGPTMKRMETRSMGRGNRIMKKTSHITVVVEEFEPKAAIKPHGTKAKPRPTLAAPVKKGKKAPAKKEEAAAAAPAEAVEEAAEPIQEVQAEVEAPAEEVAAEAPAEETAAEAPAEAGSEEEKAE